SSWILTDSTSAKDIKIMKEHSISLGEYIKGKIYAGIKTGFNKAFILDTDTKNKLIAQDGRSQDIIKPLALGKNVCKWNIKCESQYLIYTHKNIDINGFPAIYEYLNQYKHKLEQRASKQEWYELQQPQLKYSISFDKPKIVFPDIAKKQRFTIDYQNTYIDMTAFILPVDDLYLLGILNSSSVYEYFIEIGAQVRGGYLRFKRQYVEQIPIPNASDSEKETISQLVQKCLDAKGVDCEAWEKEIDDRVAALYGL
ncbi:MAG: TaqI-like C-terminal specificity domain-containing protein, partial [Waterburya sp.]